MTTKQTHKMLIMQHMRTHGSIDQWAALEFGCTKLATRISEMIHKQGIKIIKTRKEGYNRHGIWTHWTEYKLAEAA